MRGICRYTLCYLTIYQIRNMDNSRPANSRKKFLLWGSAILSSLAIFKIFTGRGKGEPGSTNEMVKMLTRDGKLVEIDKRLVASNGTKISDNELRQWISNSHN